MTSAERTGPLPEWLWKLISLLLGGGVLVSLVTWGYNEYLRRQPPIFAISAIHTLDGTNQYEITDHWVGAAPVQGVTMTWGLEVILTYYGEPRGEVQVLVKEKNGKLLARESWSPFTKESSPLRVPLDPYLIASELNHLAADYAEDNGHYIFPTMTLSVEIVEARNPSQPRYTDTLTILNTPWYHFARASYNFLWKGNTIVELYQKFPDSRVGE